MEIPTFSFIGSSSSARSTLFADRGIRFYISASVKDHAKSIFQAIQQMGGEVLPSFTVNVTHIIFHYGFTDIKVGAVCRKRRPFILHYDWIQACWDANGIVREQLYDFTSLELKIMDIRGGFGVYADVGYSPAATALHEREKRRAEYRKRCPPKLWIVDWKVKEISRKGATERLQRELITEKGKRGYAELKKRNDELLSLIKAVADAYPHCPHPLNADPRVDSNAHLNERIERAVNEERHRKFTETGAKIDEFFTRQLIAALTPPRVGTTSKKANVCKKYPWDDEDEQGKHTNEEENLPIAAAKSKTTETDANIAICENGNGDDIDETEVGEEHCPQSEYDWHSFFSFTETCLRDGKTRTMEDKEKLETDRRKTKAKFEEKEIKLEKGEVKPEGGPERHEKVKTELDVDKLSVEKGRMKVKVDVKLEEGTETSDWLQRELNKKVGHSDVKSKEGTSKQEGSAVDLLKHELKLEFDIEDIKIPNLDEYIAEDYKSFSSFCGEIPNLFESLSDEESNAGNTKNEKIAEEVIIKDVNCFESVLKTAKSRKRKFLNDELMNSETEAMKGRPSRGEEFSSKDVPQRLVASSDTLQKNRKNFNALENLFEEI